MNMEPKVKNKFLCSCYFQVSKCIFFPSLSKWLISLWIRTSNGVFQSKLYYGKGMQIRGRTENENYYTLCRTSSKTHLTKKRKKEMENQIKCYPSSHHTEPLPNPIHMPYCLDTLMIGYAKGFCINTHPQSNSFFLCMCVFCLNVYAWRTVHNGKCENVCL